MVRPHLALKVKFESVGTKERTTAFALPFFWERRSELDVDVACRNSGGYWGDIHPIFLFEKR